MADFEVDAAEKAEKPKPKPRPVKKPAAGGAAGGGAVTIFAFVVALAAVGMSLFLFFQLQKVNTKLEGKKNLKAQGTPEAIAEGEGAEAEHSEYSWQDAPLIRRFNLGEFKANTNDGKYVMLKIWLEFTSGLSEEERTGYEFQMKDYKKKLADYQKALEEYIKKNKLTWGGPGVPTGAIPAQHGGGEGAATGPPEMPEEPEAPRTVMEVQLEERMPQIRDAIITLINNHSSQDLVTSEGKEAFKKEIIDRLNALIERYYGTVDEVLFEDFLTT